MAKISCDIYRDLFPNYIENEISDSTREFMDNHLENCSECKSILNEMLEDENATNVVDIEHNEVDVLKKFNQNLIVFKYVIVLLVMIIIGAWCSISFKYYKKYKSGFEIQKVVSELYDSYENFKKCNNFILTKTYNYGYLDDSNIHHNTFYFRNGKFKELSDCYIDGDCIFRYGLIDDDIITTIDYTTNFTIKPMVCGSEWYLYPTLNSIWNILNLKPIDCNNVTIEEKNYNDILCLVINNDNNYYYFDKESKLIIRHEFIFGNKDIRYTDYSYSFGNVTDADLELEDTSGYTINNGTAEDIEIYKSR